MPNYEPVLWNECAPFDAQIDALSEHVVEMALAAEVNWRRLVPTLAKAHPRATVLDVAAAIGRAAMALEEADVVEGHAAIAARLHRLAAMTAVDAWTIGRRGWVDVGVGDLALYRRLHGDLAVEALETV